MAPQLDDLSFECDLCGEDIMGQFCSETRDGCPLTLCDFCAEYGGPFDGDDDYAWCEERED